MHTYNNIQDMLLDFAEWRLTIYYKRQEYQTAKIKAELEGLKEKLRLVFKIREGDNRQVLFTDKTNQDTQLKDWGFESDILKGVASNSYTPQLIGKLEDEIVAKQKELEEMLSITPEAQWSKELDEFARNYAKHYKLKILTIDDIAPPTELELYGPKKRATGMSGRVTVNKRGATSNRGEAEEDEITNEAQLEELDDIPAEPEFDVETVDPNSRRAAWQRQQFGKSEAAGSDDDDE